MHILFRGGHVFDGETLSKADLLIKDGVVQAVGLGLSCPDAQQVDATGCVLSPGFTDLHVHLREPGYEHKETVATGTASAAAGGFTTVCSMPNLLPVPDSREHMDIQLDAIEKDAIIHVLPFAALTVGERGEKLADIKDLASVAVGFSDDGVGVQDAELMKQAMAAVAKSGSFVAAHCEMNHLLPSGSVCVQEGCRFAREHGYIGYPSESEWSEVERDIRLAEETGCRLHICHTSAQTSFDLVRAAKTKGLPVTCEVSPHNLLLSCDDISEDDGRFKMNPPLRDPEDVLAATRALLDGTVDAIATDHAPHTNQDKEGGFAKSANGIVGLETAFAVLHSELVKGGELALARLLELLTNGPRKVAGLPVQKIQPGQPVDLVVLDLAKTQTVDPEKFVTKGRRSPFAGWELTGWPVMTLLDDKIVYQAKK